MSKVSNQNKPIISATGVSKSYENFAVLKEVNVSIQEGEKIGLVGPNGSGKTTLMKILAGLGKPDQGTVVISKKHSFGYIPQNFNEYSAFTVKEFIQSVVGKDLEKVRIEPTFDKLNLNNALLDRKMSELSGGERTKVALVRIFLADQDVLLLDEPTNNLDIEALLLLEDFVQKSNKTFLIISHDREFLNKAVNRIFEIDEFTRGLHIYEGNFSSYLEERLARYERQWIAFNDSMKKKDRTKEIIEQKLQRAHEIENSEKHDDDKFLRNFKIEHAGRAFQKGAKNLKNKLEKMEEVERPREPLPLNLEFSEYGRSGDKIFELINVTKKLPERTIGPITLTIQFGDRLLITGPNGAGKTTFIKMLLSKVQPDSGTITPGTKLNVGYLPQEEDLLSDSTVTEEFLRHVEIEEGLARRTLHRFKLTADDVNKKIKQLSSGERSRLILAILMTQKANCLILDEPSNHLDLEVLESLEAALEKFKGTLIVVSHDRYFIDRLRITKKLEL